MDFVYTGINKSRDPLTFWRQMGEKRPRQLMAKTGRKSYHRGNVKEDLLRAARTAVLEGALESISVRGLCADVGVTPGNFYNHYDNLDDLLAHLAVEFFVAYQERIQQARNRHRKPLLRLKAGAREFVQYAYENPQAYRLMFGTKVPSMMKQPIYREASERAMRNTVLEIYGEDIYAVDDTSKSQKECVHAYTFFALLNGLARDVIDGLVDLDSPTAINAFVDRVLDSLLLGGWTKELGDRF